MKRKRCLVPLLLLALVSSGCGGRSPADGTEGFADRSGIVEQIPLGDRPEVATITGTLLDGGDFDSRDLAGEIVVYNTWGSWCTPCRKEAPALRQVSEETRQQGVSFIGINVRDNDPAAIAFERSFGITYPSIRTADSPNAMSAFGTRLPPSAIPSTIVVDRDGRIAARVIGPSTATTLRELLDDVLAEAPPDE